MLRHIIALTLLFVSSVFAMEGPGPINMDVSIEETTGYNDPVDVEISLGINQDYENYELLESKAELEIFLPPALEITEGSLSWKGIINRKYQESVRIKVKTTLKKPLMYDIGFAVRSDAMKKPVVHIRHFFLDENKGITLDIYNSQEQIINTPWLRNALNYSEKKRTDDKGKEITYYEAIGDDSGDLPESVITDKSARLLALQDHYPNRIFSKEFISIIEEQMPPEKTSKIKSGLRKKSIDIDSPVLAGQDIWWFGYVDGAMGAVINAKAELYAWLSGTRMGPIATVYTDSDGGFDGYVNDAWAIADSFYVKIILKNSYGDYIGGLPYFIDNTYVFNPDIHVLCFFFSCFPPSMNDQVCAHEHLRRVRERTVNDAGYNPPYIKCEYPVPNPCNEEVRGCYRCSDLPGMVPEMEIACGQLNSISHEFGHHISCSKNGITGGGGKYIRDLCYYPLMTAQLSFEEGWADAFRDWINYDNEPEGFYCDEPTIEAQKTCRAGIYDLFDSGYNEGDRGNEYCQLSMGLIINGFDTGIADIQSFMSKLMQQNPGAMLDIIRVVVVNQLYPPGGLLLASEADISLPEAFSRSELYQNSPNPFNPSTTISYSVGGSEPEYISLNIYDLRGKRVKTLVSGLREPSRYTVFWDGKDDKGNAVSSGIYFYKLKAGDFTSIRKMVIVK